jgi:hypothetical protein
MTGILTDILTAGKYFIDTQVLSAYTSAIKKQCFIKYQIISGLHRVCY